MTREETIKLLELVTEAYPNAKIKDAGRLVSSWELTLGEYPAEAVYKAARLHMSTSSFFPVPADIIKKIPKAAAIYKEDPARAIPEKAGNRPSDAERWAAFLEDFCAWIGFGCEADPEVDLTKNIPK